MARIKIRLMGTSRDCETMENLFKAMERHNLIEILEATGDYQNRGESKFVRRYFEVEINHPDLVQ